MATTDITWGAAAEKGLRDNMEDQWTVEDSGVSCGYFYACVMDGHGGVSASEFLRENLFSAVDQAISISFADDTKYPGKLEQGGSRDGGYLAKSLIEVFETQDASLHENLKSMPEPERSSGSTCTMVLVRRDRIICANVGDSRALLIRANKGFTLTPDHRPVISRTNRAGKSEIERVMRAGGWCLDGRVCDILGVSRAFGDNEFKEGRFQLLKMLKREGNHMAKTATMRDALVVATPDVTEIARHVSDQWLIVASDGLWDSITSAECTAFVKEQGTMNPNMTAADLARALVKLALASQAKDDEDNCAVVVLDLRD
jgi:protein phosphatase 1A